MSRKRQTQERSEPRQMSGFIPRSVSARSENQRTFIKTVQSCEITFAHGPAGTGKTHIAVALAAQALKHGQTEKIILCRPAVESGPSIGFLPGTMLEKLDPYLRPLYDELGYYIEKKTILAKQEHGVIEIVPLSMMRGRTFVNSWIILDEAQNATHAELRMFLTRIGMNSKMVVVGDLVQSDLPMALRGGLAHCLNRLEGMDGIGVCGLDARDIVRHRLIGEIESRLSYQG